jgi:chloramphenicol-sensitive protein RarD
MSAPEPASQRRIGILHAITAYTLWGALPFYWKMMAGFPLWETLAQRAFWSFLTILVLLPVLGRFKTFVLIVRDPARLRLLGLSACFIGANWSIYVFAMDSNQVIQASLGYYINPLVTVGMGVFLLRERLNRVQVISVALAAVGVVLLAFEHHGLPWVALGLTGTFSVYGLLKKRVVVDPLAGLGVEAMWMTPFSLAYLVPFYARHAPHAFATGAVPTLLLMGTGFITLAPLFFFAGAATRLPLSTLGIFQYLSPSIQLLSAVFLFHEPFTRVHMISFGFIWAALALYSVHGWRMRARLRSRAEGKA